MHVYLSSRTKCFMYALLLAILPGMAAGAQESGPESAAGVSQERLAEESLLLPEAEPEREDVSAEAPMISSWDFIRMFLILGAVVGVIYLIFYFLKRGLRRQLPENEMIRLLGTRNLAGNRSLHLVELGKTVFLLGAAEGGITLISEVKDQETLDMLRVESSKARIPAQGFGQFFQSILKGGRSSGLGVQQGTIDFMKQQRQRLNKL